MDNIKVHFELEIIEDGFPPIAVESLNARLHDDGKIELDNTPFLLKVLLLEIFFLAESLIVIMFSRT